MERGRILLEGTTWAARVERAATTVERMRGLLGRSSLGPGAALLIERCGAVHTMGMRFALDLVFLDRGWRIVRVVRNVRAGRLLVWGGWRATRVVESELGCLEMGNVQVGRTMKWFSVG